MFLLSQIFHSGKSFFLWIKWRKNPGLNWTGYFIFLAGCFSIKFLWCSSFIFMLLKMEQIYQMSKLIVIKWSKYWRKTPTRSSHYNNIATTHFSDALIIFLSRILLYSESERRPIISSVLSLSARASGSVVLQNLMLFMLL